MAPEDYVWYDMWYFYGVYCVLLWKPFGASNYESPLFSTAKITTYRFGTTQRGPNDDSVFIVPLKLSGKLIILPI